MFSDYPFHGGINVNPRRLFLRRSRALPVVGRETRSPGKGGNPTVTGEYHRQGVLHQQVCFSSIFWKMEDISHFLWFFSLVSKPGYLPYLHALSPSPNGFLRFTSGATPTDLFAASMTALIQVIRQGIPYQQHCSSSIIDRYSTTAVLLERDLTPGVCSLFQVNSQNLGFQRHRILSLNRQLQC